MSDRTPEEILKGPYGPAPRAAERIFDEFSTTRKAGFGLGLSTSRRFARAMCADLILDRRWIRGACFVVTLPAGMISAANADPAPVKEIPCKAA